MWVEQSTYRYLTTRSVFHILCAWGFYASYSFAKVRFTSHTSNNIVESSAVFFLIETSTFDFIAYIDINPKLFAFNEQNSAADILTNERFLKLPTIL